MAGALFAVAYLVIAVRLAVVTLLSDGAEPRLAALPAQPAQVERGEIVDRNGVVLATNLADRVALRQSRSRSSTSTRRSRGLTELLPDISPIDPAAEAHERHARSTGSSAT